MTTGPIGAPDGQRPTVAPQKLLATVAGGTASTTVDVPPNAETISVVAESNVTGSKVSCTGVTTGIQYPGVAGQQTNLVNFQWVFQFQVSNAADSQVTISHDTAPPNTWYVIADSGVRAVADIAVASSQGISGDIKPGVGLLMMGADGLDAYNLRSDTRGALLSVPVVPGTGSGDHPPDEVTNHGAILTAAGSFITAPGAGLRLRLFSLQVVQFSGTIVGRLYNTSTLATLIGNGNAAFAEINYPAQGYPFTENAGIDLAVDSGSGDLFCNAVLTTETV